MFSNPFRGEEALGCGRQQVSPQRMTKFTSVVQPEDSSNMHRLLNYNPFEYKFPENLPDISGLEFFCKPPNSDTQFPRGRSNSGNQSTTCISGRQNAETLSNGVFSDVNTQNTKPGSKNHAS